jgi:multidrug efflux pump
LIYGALIVAVGLLFVRLPTGFLPTEDQGIAYIQVQTPAGSTQGTTWNALGDVANYLLHEEGNAVDSALEVNGLNFAGRGQNQGPGLRTVQGLVCPDPRRPQGAGGARPHGQALRLLPGCGHRSDQSAGDPRIGNRVGLRSGARRSRRSRATSKLMQARDQLIAMAREDPNLALVRANGLSDNPTVQDRHRPREGERARINLSDVDQTVLDRVGFALRRQFLDTDGRIKKVYVQADAAVPDEPGRPAVAYVRNIKGSSVRHVVRDGRRGA